MPTPASPERLKWILLVVSGATFLDFLDVTVVNLAFPELRRDFANAAVGDLAWVITGYAVTFAALLTPLGRLADVSGRRRMFLAGVALFALSSLACALAPSLGVLIGARLVQGASAAMTLPAGLGIVLAASPLEKRAAAIGIWAAAGAVAALIGPTIGGVLVDTLGWRAVFFVNLPFAALILFGALRLIEPSPRMPGRLPDLAGAGLVAAGIGLLVLAVTQAPEWGWTSTRTLGAAGAGAVFSVWALRRASRHPAPAIETSLWRTRQLAVANACSLFIGAAVFAWLLLCVLFLTTVWGYGEIKAGLAVSPGAVSAAFAAALIGRRVERGGYRAAVVVGSVVLFLDGLWLALALGPGPQFVGLWLPAGLIAGAAMGAMAVGVSTAVATAVSPDRYAAATGMNLTARQIGGALGIAVLAAILQAGVPERGIDPFLDVFLVCALASLGAAIVALRLGPAPAPLPVPVAQEA